jgi:hypothetical protein
MKAVFVAEGAKPLVHDSYMVEAGSSLRRYDQYVNVSNLQGNDASDRTLAEGLDQIVKADEDLLTDSDAVLVISDFLAPNGLKDGNPSFEWRRPLLQLKQQLGDRLFAIKLTTPAQSNLPLAPAYVKNRKIHELDLGDYLKAAEMYSAAAAEKTVCLNGLLRGVRRLDFSSQSQRPLIELSDFIFGKNQLA